VSDGSQLGRLTIAALTVDGRHMTTDDDSWVALGQWNDVAKGLRMFRAYLITLIAFTVVTLLVTIVIATSGKASALSSITSMAKVSAIIGLFISLFGILAVERYSRIAPETGARGAAKAALYLGIVSLVVAGVSIFRLLTVTDLDQLASLSAWDIITRILGAIQFFCFLGSLRTCASYIGSRVLYDLAGKTMTLAGVTLTLAVFSQILSGATAPVLLLGLGTLGIGIWCLVYLMMLLSRLAKAVSRDAHLPATFS